MQFLYQQLYNIIEITISDPNTFSLSHVLNAVVQRLTKEANAEQNTGVTVAQSLVMLIFSQHKRITQSDFDSAVRIMHSSLYQFPDLYFVFVTNDAKTFDELNTNGENQNEIWRREQYKIIATNTTDFEEFSGQLYGHLKTIPKRIVQPFCQLNSNEWRWKNNIDLRYRKELFYFVL